MSFTPQFLDELRQRLSLVSVISRKVRLVRRGRESTGLCPFHNEKSPSFTVSDEKGFFHCFGCGAHGDVIGFLMRSEGLSFPESVERLAREAGLALPVSSPEERQRAERQSTLVTAMETAAAWYQEQLAGSAGRGALDYLRRRGLAEGTIARFRLGYAPEGRTALRDALTRAGVSVELAQEAGLVGKGEDGALFDRMRGRVIFPIADRRGRVIAFGGRILGEGQPKYLNSPETPLFHKGRTLYGLGQALRPAKDAGEVVVAEGYMDVIALSEAGFPQAVAPLGTALTEEQIAELWRLVPEPTLCFDGDAAGERAAARAADRALPLLKPGQSLRFAMLPEGEDPDTLILAEGSAAMRALLDRALPLA
ncbi:MAG TPA: DNA primase, partial [Dongiaceae bacterium]